VPPIDFLCHDCGASFELGVASLASDDYRPGCPDCESDRVATDWDAVVGRFPAPGGAEASRQVPVALRED
jgi:hypothetical protein